MTSETQAENSGEREKRTKGSKRLIKAETENKQHYSRTEMNYCNLKGPRAELEGKGERADVMAELWM